MTSSLDRRHTTRTRALGVAAAVLAALATWVVAVPLLGVDLRIAAPTGPQAVGPGVVATFALVASLLGWVLLVVLERLTRRAATVWAAVAMLVLLVSLVPPIASAVTAGGAAVLVVMHLVVAAALVPPLYRSARP